jgi:hypothetical protein
MAARDFAPYGSPLGGHYSIRAARLNANTLRVGEPVLIEADGDVAVVGDDPAAATVAGVALAPVGSGLGFENPTTGAAYAAGDMVSYVVADNNSVFITNVAHVTDNAGVAVAVTRANIGDPISIQLAGGVFSIAPNAGNTVGRIIDVLDSGGNSLNQTNAGAATHVLFKLGAAGAGM